MTRSGILADPRRMRATPNVRSHTAASVAARLEAAGRTLLALPLAAVHPLVVTAWPPERVPRCPLPAPSAIEDMADAFAWCDRIEDPELRLLVQRRALVLPDSPTHAPRYVWPWRRLQRCTGLHGDTLQARWGRGIDAIVRALNGARWPAG